jgi:Zn-dependent metalloprotease
MNKLLPIALLFSIMMWSCEKYDIPKNYPSTYYKISSTTLSQKQSDYKTRNPFICTSLNEFGFCDYSLDQQYEVTPPYVGEISQENAIEIIKEFVINNSNESGIQSPDVLTFLNWNTNNGSNGVFGWNCRTSNQKIDTIEVLNAYVIFHINNGEVIRCRGNWFPEIFIPRKFNISQEKAKNDLIGKEVSHYTFAGVEYFVTISKTDIENSNVDLIIIPEEDEEKIELHLCWQINIPGPVYYNIYVDVMTGSIIGQNPTIIS